MSEWTKEIPTVPGYYWLRNYLFAESKANGFSASREVEIVSTYRSFADEPLDLTFSGNDCVAHLADLLEGEWFGPLEPPKE